MAMRIKKSNKSAVSLNPYASQAIMNAGIHIEDCNQQKILYANSQVTGPGWYKFYTGYGYWDFTSFGDLTKKQIKRFRKEERDMMGDDVDIDPNCINNDDESCMVYVHAV